MVRRSIAQISKESLVILFSFAGFSPISCLSLACFACVPLAGKYCQDFQESLVMQFYLLDFCLFLVSLLLVLFGFPLLG